MTCEELDRRITQEAVKRDGKGPYPPNLDNCVATVLSTEALNCFLSVVHVPYLYVYGYHESAS